MTLAVSEKVPKCYTFGSILVRPKYFSTHSQRGISPFFAFTSQFSFLHASDLQAGDEAHGINNHSSDSCVLSSDQREQWQARGLILVVYHFKRVDTHIL